MAKVNNNSFSINSAGENVTVRVKAPLGPTGTGDESAEVIAVITPSMALTIACRLIWTVQEVQAGYWKGENQ